MTSKLVRAGRDYGWLLAFIACAITLIISLVILPGAGVDTTPLSDDKTVIEIPATGVSGFRVEEFCTDDRTKVKADPTPEVGFVYTLTRVKDGVTETVTYVPGPSNDNRTATHYFDTNGAGQASEPATVSDDARACIMKKAATR